MFREPLRRDPLVVGWGVVMLVAAFVALSNNTTWSGHFEADRVAGFLKETAQAFLWSFLLLLLLAWLRAQGWRGNAGRQRRASRQATPARDPFEPFPWTDRWLRDWREADAQRRQGEVFAEVPKEALPEACRHGVPVDNQLRDEQTPVLRALSVSHSIVRPGSSVSVTWCFEHGDDVIVDGQRGYPSCGEALVRIERTRRVEVIGTNRHGKTPVVTASIVAMSVPQLDLPTVDSPPIVSLRADVAADIGNAASVTRRLDDFWETQDSLRPQLAAPPRLIGAPPRFAAMPASVVEGIRRARPATGEDTK